MKFKAGYSFALTRHLYLYVVRDARRGVSNFEEMTWCRVTQQKYVGNSRQIVGCAGLP